MSDDYFPVCFRCKAKYDRYFASASAFYSMRTPFWEEDELRAFEDWLGQHERHDVRIVWEQDELPWEVDDE